MREVNERAFEQRSEADLVEAVRRIAETHLSFVAEDDGRVVGHILFSPVHIEPSFNRNLRLLGLAPMAVLPERQRQGIGAALVRKGLRACRKSGCHAVFVLGHPDYYPRFGFEPAQNWGLRTEYDAPTEAFMALELVHGSLEGMRGTVTYNTAFDQVG